jgi:ribose-phosphate pyrophosphokinase
MSADETIKLFSGTAHPALAASAAAHLNLEVAKCRIGRFADGEISVEILESVRGKDVYVIQSLSSPVNDHLMELLIIVDALRRSSARTITAVLPYCAYARQDRQDRPRTPITAKLVANLIDVAGVDRVMAMDLHALQLQGFFSCPVEHLWGSQVLMKAMRRVAGTSLHQCVVVAPDAGGVERARYVSSKLGIGLAIIDKRRPRANVSEVMHVIGDVAGMRAFIVDDMVDTAGTLCSAAKALAENGATEVHAFATHGLLNGPAIERIDASVLASVHVCDTIPLRANAVESPKIVAHSVGATIGEAIQRVHVESSVSSMFHNDND